MHIRRRGLALITTLLLSVTIATACGKSDDGGGSAGSADSASANSGTDGAEVSGGTGAVTVTSDLDEMKKLVDQYTTRPTSIGYDVPFDGDIEPGKEIAWVRCSPPSCVALGQPLKAAVEAVGWKFREIDAGVTPESVKAAWQQLLQDPPDAVVTLSAPPSFYAEELKKMRAKGVPVVVQSVDAEPSPDGVNFNFTGMKWWYDVGERLAQYFLVNRAETDTDVLSVETSAIPTITNGQQGFKDYLAATCDDCKVDSMELPLETVGGDAPQKIVSYLSAHPDTKWVYTSFVDVNIGLWQALKASGLDDVHVVTINTTETQNQEIVDGAPIVTHGYPEQEVNYRIVDWLLRYFAGQDTKPAEEAPLPTFVITPDNIPGSTFYFVDGGDEDFLKLWGIS